MSKAATEARTVMGIEDAASYLGVSKDTLYRYAREGYVPAFRMGNRWRFRRSLLDKWMDAESQKGMTKRG